MVYCRAMAHKAHKKKMRQTPVTRTFLRTLADKIYDSRNRTYLRLCDGVLQNGPDPKDKKRPMHCGLGELYYAMTGLQPEETGVSEQDVIELTMERSTHDTVEGAREKAEAAIEKLDVVEEVKQLLIQTVTLEDDDTFVSDDAREFRRLIAEIPGKNDDGCDEENCSVDVYRARSKRVASQLREAAKYLPKD